MSPVFVFAVYIYNEYHLQGMSGQKSCIFSNEIISHTFVIDLLHEKCLNFCPSSKTSLWVASINTIIFALLNL